MESLKELKEFKVELEAKLTELKEDADQNNKGILSEAAIVEWDAINEQLIETFEKINSKERFEKLATPSMRKEIVSGSVKSNLWNKEVDHDSLFKAWSATVHGRREYVTHNQREMASRSGFDLDQRELSAFVRWDQEKATTTLGGHSVNEAIVTGVVRKLKAFGGMLAWSTVRNTADGTPYKKTVRDATSRKAVKTDELADISNVNSTENTVSFSSIEFTTGIFPISLQLLRDVAYPILDEYIDEMAESFYRAFNEQLTVGDGVGDVNGVETACSDSGVVATSGAISHDNLLDLVNQVDPAYYFLSGKTCFMLNHTEWTNLKKSLKDDGGRPLYNLGPIPNVVNGPPRGVNGIVGYIEEFPVVVNQDVSNDTILFGDFSRYETRLVGDMVTQRLNELYAIKHAIGLVAHWAIDGDLLDTGAIKKLVATAGS